MFKVKLSLIIYFSFIGAWCILDSDTYPFGLRISKEADQHISKGPIKGMTLGMHSDDYDYRYTKQIKEIKDLKPEWLQLNIKFFQDHNNSSLVNIPEDDSYFWIQLEETIDLALSENFKLSLLPIVLIEDPEQGEWRGTIDPMDRNSWYKSYKKLILKLATLAEAKEIEMFSVGSEYCSMQVDKDSWTDIIESCRQVYNGALFYSANWDAIEEVEFTEELDFLGITGYNSLTESNEPSFGDLLLAWEEIKIKLLALQKSKGLPLFFSEVGYTSQDGTNKNPWNYMLSDTADELEQLMCYQAFLNTWENEKAFFGAFIYDWFDNGGSENLGYSVKNKAAEPILRSWYQQ